MTDTLLLEQYIKDSGLKKSKIANALGITYAGFGKKCKNETEFKASEIQILCKLLGISTLDDKDRVFFAKTVE